MVVAKRDVPRMRACVLGFDGGPDEVSAIVRVRPTETWAVGDRTTPHDAVSEYNPGAYDPRSKGTTTLVKAR
jgi:hypothetical protein